MLTKTYIQSSLKEMQPYLQKHFQVKKLGLFGSFSRGEETQESDIDILVDFRTLVGLEFFELQTFLEKKFQRKVDLVLEDCLKPELKDIILKEVEYIDENQTIL